jgi:gliding motility-associated-like protein
MKDFNEILKQKLENYQPTPPETVLNNIRTQYPKRSFVEQLNYNKYYIIAAASILIITGLLLLNSNQSNKNIPSNSDETTQIVNNNNTQVIENVEIEHKNIPKPENNNTPNNITNTIPENKQSKKIQIEYVDIFSNKDTTVCGGSIELYDIAEINNIIVPSSLNLTKKASNQNCIVINCNNSGKYIVYYQKEDSDKILKDSLVILFNKVNKPDFEIENRKLCYGEELIISLPKSDGNFTFNNTDAIKLNENQYKIPKLKSGNNSIQILYSDSNNCGYLFNENVYMSDKPNYDITITSDYCSKNLGTIMITADNFTLKSSTINDDISSKTGSFINLSSGIYFAKTEYSENCYVFDTLLVKDSLNINPFFKIERSLMDKSKYSIRNYTKIDNKGFEQNPDVVFTWKVNGEVLASEDNPDFTFDKQGKYTIELIAQANSECISTYSETIHVSGTSLRIPNIFTPNGDGIGDYFGVAYDDEIINFQIQIINRIGEIVFEESDINKFWDGKINGNDDASEGLYYYIIRGEDAFGNKIEQKGSLQLVRN